MSFIKTMQERYTTKNYDASKKIDLNQLEQLKEILQLSPSSINSQPWKFTFVRNQEVKKQLSEISWINTPKVLDCDTVVVFSRVDDLTYFENQIKENLPQGAVDYYNEYIKPQPETEIKSWFDKQVYLALGIFLSACASMGIDSTPMEGIEPDNYDKILGQTTHKTLVAVAIGYRDPADQNQPEIKPKSRVALKKIVTSI